MTTSRCRTKRNSATPPAATRPRGIALVAVLWVLVLLSVMAAGLLRDTTIETQTARNLLDNAEARALADAGVYRAVIGLMDRDAEARWQSDGRAYPWAFGDGALRISIFDEAGKIDLNLAPDDLVEGLFLALGAEPEHARLLVHAIADFRDTDDIARADGAEDADYRAAGLAWEAKDAPFAMVAELEQVLGMTRALYQAAAPHLTVHAGRGGRIDPSKASAVVLSAIPGITDADIESLLDSRAIAAEDDAAQGATTIVGLKSYVARSRGRVVTVRVEALGGRGGVFVREAVLRLRPRGARPYEILAWRQGAPAETPPQADGVGEE